jgi:hypothetical protein
MANEITKRWIDAGKAIGVDPEAEILCPICQKTFLQVTDVRNEKNRSELERHMTCKECGAYNALRMVRPE